MRRPFYIISAFLLSIPALSSGIEMTDTNKMDVMVVIPPNLFINNFTVTNSSSRLTETTFCLTHKNAPSFRVIVSDITPDHAQSNFPNSHDNSIRTHFKSSSYSKSQALIKDEYSNIQYISNQSGQECSVENLSIFSVEKTNDRVHKKDFSKKTMRFMISAE